MTRELARSCQTVALIMYLLKKDGCPSFPLVRIMAENSQVDL
jgi:hypothetical protein